MRILFVADGRSPTALNWMRYDTERGDQVYLATTFACQPDLPLSGLEHTPVAFSGLKTAASNNAPKRGLWGASTLRLRTLLRQWLGPTTIARSAPRLRGFIQRTQPDLVHAMRIPYEGMLAADASTGLAPLLIQVGSAETLLDDSIQLAGVAGAAEVPVRLEVWPEMIHVWHFFHPILADARTALADAGAFIKARMG